MYTHTHTYTYMYVYSFMSTFKNLNEHIKLMYYYQVGEEDSQI